MIHKNKVFILLIIISLSFYDVSSEFVTDLDQFLSRISIENVNNFLESELNDLQKVKNVTNNLMCTMQLSWFTKALKDGKLWAFKRKYNQSSVSA